MSEPWTMKVKVMCPVCQGHKYIYDADSVELGAGLCSECGGTGQCFREIPPEAIEEFTNKYSTRPPQTEFQCSCCHREEVILRPLEHQVPFGWWNWSGDLVCNDCRVLVISAAISGAEQKIRQLKEKKQNA